MSYANMPETKEPLPEIDFFATFAAVLRDLRG
jgi:hypothetical protein